MSTTHQAAWLTGKQVRPLKVDQAPTVTLKPDQVLVRVRAVAINPIDWMLQSDAFMDLPYPFVLGKDAAGEIEAVGSAVTSFKPGDRVLGQSVLLLTLNPSEGTFQELVVMYDNLVSKIPDSLPFEKACVIPLGFSTAACGMFLDDYLGLRLPTDNAKDQGCLVIWGGATSVGLNAIQLAVASGYQVVATASSSNAALLKSIGVTSVFDYRSPTVVEDILSATNGKQIVGALDCVCKSNSSDSLVAMLSKSNPSTTNRFIAAVLPTAEKLADGVSAKYIHGVALRGNKEISRALYGEFLPSALAKGTFLPLPEAQVVGHGLETIQEAMDVQRAGVSAKKVVVTL
jgi:NADPH:quinone reductase-like Zn-dependent oxidoreductase